MAIWLLVLHRVHSHYGADVCVSELMSGVCVWPCTGSWCRSQRLWRYVSRRSCSCQWAGWSEGAGKSYRSWSAPRTLQSRPRCPASRYLSALQTAAGTRWRWAAASDVSPNLSTAQRQTDRQTEKEKICEATISHRSYSCSLPLANIRWHHPILQHFFFSSVILNLTLKKYRPKNPCKLTHRKNLLLSLARTLKTSEERDSVPWVLCKQKLLQINTNLNQQMNRLTVIVNVVLM